MFLYVFTQPNVLEMHNALDSARLEMSTADSADTSTKPWRPVMMMLVVSSSPRRSSTDISSPTSWSACNQPVDFFLQIYAK